MALRMNTHIPITAQLFSTSLEKHWPEWRQAQARPERVGRLGPGHHRQEHHHRNHGRR